MSTKPLNNYFDVLNLFAEASYDNVDSSCGIDMEMLTSLVEEGCISGTNVNTLDGPAFINVSLTSHGAVLLAEWSSILERTSFKGRIFSILEKFLWIIVGAVISLISGFY